MDFNKISSESEGLPRKSRRSKRYNPPLKKGSTSQDKENAPVNLKRPYPFTPEPPPLLRSASSVSSLMSFSESFHETSDKGIDCYSSDKLQSRKKRSLQAIPIHPSSSNVSISPNSVQKTTRDLNPISISCGSPSQFMITRSRRLPSTSSELRSSQAAAGGESLDMDLQPAAEEDVSSGAAGAIDGRQHESSPLQAGVGGENLIVDSHLEAEEQVSSGTRENVIVMRTNSTSIERQLAHNEGQELNPLSNRCGSPPQFTISRSRRLLSSSSELSSSQAAAGGENLDIDLQPAAEEDVSSGAAIDGRENESIPIQAGAGGENLIVDLQSEAEDEVSSGKRKKVIVRQTTSTSRKERQLARNKGQEYVTASGKIIEKKVAKPLPKCRRGCADKVPPDVCVELCDSIWTNLGDANARRAYLSGQIQPSLKQSQRVNQLDTSKKKKNRVFTVRYFACVKGINTEVCKECFMKIYQVSKKVIEVITGRKIGNIGGVQANDRRGESSQTLAEERLQAVIAHINSFPRYKSHYARNKTDKEFLPSNLTVKIMYDEYVKGIEKPEDAVSRWTYEREFHKLGLKIKPLKIDTCHTCDTLQMAVKNSKSEMELSMKKSLQEKHHLKAQEAIDVKKQDRLRAKSEEKVETAAFDLQQCLPTPNLPSSIVFYLRQLWVYNLTIHIMSSDQSLHNMWHEGEGGRGANQVGSALYRFIMNLPDEVEHLILWSDTCGGQNKNAIINTALITALNKKKTLKTIDQKFLVPGHTHLECDSDHALIEEKKKRSGEIHIPRDWYNLVRGASKKFTVHLLGRDQLDFKSLHTGRDSPFVKRKVSTTKDKFVWKNVVWLQHRRNLPLGVVAFKTSFSDEEDFSYLDMRRRKNSSIELSPKAAYAGPNKISAKKKKDLLSMLHLVDPDCHAFYHALQTDDGEADDIDPDILPSSDVEDSEEE